LELILQQYQHYSADVMGLRPATCAVRLRWARLWLDHLGVTNHRDLAHLSAAQLVDCLRHPPDTVARQSLAEVVSGLRCWLKFLYAQGHLARPLAFALPAVASPALPPPEYLSPVQWEQVLRRVDRRRKVGRRDYAILLCAARLGLRAGEIATLQLNDLDWDQGTVCLGRSKNRRQTLLPLCPVVGQALAAYLQHGRPVSPEPCGALAWSSAGMAPMCCAGRSRCGWLSKAIPSRPWLTCCAISRSKPRSATSKPRARSSPG
jgi:integrase